MRSSVFKADPPRIGGTKGKSIRKSVSASPYMTSSSPSLGGSKLKSGVLSRKAVTWNLDELLQAYQENHELPPILSPTIPENVTKNNEAVIEIDKPKESPITKIISKSVPLQSPKPKYPVKKRIIDEDLDSEYNANGSKPASPFVPGAISLLSPTLPTMFDKPDTPKSRGAMVRSINKLHDPKPKLLVRIKFDNTKAYKQAIVKKEKKLSSPVKLAGLGIVTNGVGAGKEKLEKKVESEVKDSIIERPKNDDRKIREQELSKQEKILAQKREHDLIKQEKVLAQRLRDLEDKQRKLHDREQAIKSLEKELAEHESKLKHGASTPSLDPQVPSPSLTLEQQKKREQLKQLNKDVIMKELVTNVEMKRHIPPPPPKLSSLSKSQREDIKQRLIDKKTYWISIVKDCRIISQKESDGFLEIIINVDIILMSMISNDYDERSKVVAEILPSERSWRSLDQDMKQLIITIDKFTTNLQEKNLLEFLKILRCILFQLRAILIKRINSILTKAVISYSNKLNGSDKNNGDLQTRIIDLQQSCIKNHDLINNYFVSSKPSYLISIIPIKFPITWFKKSLTIEREVSDPLEDYEFNLKPNDKQFYLPIGTYSNLCEMSGFLYSVIREFIDIFNRYNPKQKINYTLQSGKH